MSKPVSEADWQRIAERTAARNGSIEVRPDPQEHGACCWEGDAARVRLLEADPGGWLIEEPGERGHRKLQAGMTILGVVNAGVQRVGFRARVLAKESARLNARQQVVALRLSRPTDIHSAQRRAYFRVATQDVNVPPVWLWSMPGRCDDFTAVEAAVQRAHRPGGDVELDLDRCRPPVGAFLVGKLHDISGSGLGVVLDPRRIHVLQDVGRLWGELSLPESPAALAMAVRPVRLSKRSTTAVLLGLAFSDDHSPAYREFLADTICQFAAAQQRRRLRRKA